MDRPQAKLVRAIEQGYYKTYIFSCVDCGKEFVRSANNKRINPYCGECQRKYDRIRNAENKAKRQAEHDKQIRAEVIEEFANKIREYSGEHYIDCDGYACKTDLVFKTDEFLDYIVEQLKQNK